MVSLPHPRPSVLMFSTLIQALAPEQGSLKPFITVSQAVDCSADERMPA